MLLKQRKLLLSTLNLRSKCKSYGKVLRSRFATVHFLSEPCVLNIGLFKHCKPKECKSSNLSIPFDQVNGKTFKIYRHGITIRKVSNVFGSMKVPFQRITMRKVCGNNIWVRSMYFNMCIEHASGFGTRCWIVYLTFPECFYQKYFLPHEMANIDTFLI